MTRTSLRFARYLALVVPCVAILAGVTSRPAVASPVDSRAVCREAGGINLNKSENATACNTQGAGTYTVVFDGDVDTCTYVAAIGIPGSGTPPAGLIGVSYGSDRNKVKVHTRNTAGVLQNRPFHLIVDC